MKIIGGGQVTDIGQKAITSIPGWAEILNEAIRRGEGEGKSLYKNSAWAYTCVNKKAEALAGIEWGFFDSNDEEVERPNVARVLMEASTEENWNDVMRGVGADMDIYGQAFLEKIGESTVVGLSRLNASTMKPIIKKNTGEIVGFVQNLPNGKEVQFEREQVIYFHTYNPDNDLIGLSALEVAKYPILTELHANRFLAAFFRNDATPGALLSTEQMLQDPDFSRIRRWWDRTFRGTDNSHKVAVADKGLKYQQIQSSLSDLALEKVRAEARRDICAVLGVPPALAGAWEAANYASSEEQRQSFYTETIFPRAQYIAGVLNAELIQQMDPNIKFGWKFMELDVMQPDMVAERLSISQLVRAGVITPMAGALQLGYQEDEAGIGPVMTSIVDEDADVVPGHGEDKSKMHVALEKWKKKAKNRLLEGNPAQVDFESVYIPAGVNKVIYGQLADAHSNADVSEIFKGYM